MLDADTPVPVQALKLSNIGSGQYFDGHSLKTLGAAGMGSDIYAG